MITCICHNVNDKTIQSIIIKKNIHTISELKKEITVCEQCKKCAPEIKEIIKANKEKNNNH